MSIDRSTRDRLVSLSREGRLYFGYGSNLNASDYRDDELQRKPLTPICSALAPDCALVFDRWSVKRGCGVLSLEDSPGALIDGGLFEVRKWDDLDKKEGAPNAYVRIPIRLLVKCEDGIRDEITAQTYVTTRPDGFHKPSDEYLEICRQGRKDFQGRKGFHLSTGDLNLAARNKPNGFGWKNHNVFTYGTLCRGESRESVMRGGPVDQVGMAETFGLTLWAAPHGGYPCMKPAKMQCLDEHACDHEPPGPVVGDLWSFRVTRRKDAENLANIFRSLDQIEGDNRPGVRQMARDVCKAISEGRTVDEASSAIRDEMEHAIAQSLFRRTLINVNFGGRGRRAWTYLYASDEAELLPITSGNWRKYVGRWDGLLNGLAEGYIGQAGGIDAIRAAASESWYTSHIANLADAADLARQLDSGAVEERELIVDLGSKRFGA